MLFRSLLIPVLCLALLTAAIGPTWAQVVERAATAPSAPFATATEPQLAADTIAFYRFDPAGLQPPAGWLGPLMQLLDAAGVVRLEEQPVADGLLVATMLASYPHTTALLDLTASRHIPGQIDLATIRAVTVLDAPGRHPQLRQTLESILKHYGRVEDRLQTIIDLPGDRRGIRYRLADWPEWMSLEWFADAQQFYFGLGTDSLHHWFQRQRPMASEPRLARHRQAVADPKNTAPMIEFFVDFQRLRSAMPTLFRTGRTTPLLKLLQLENAHEVMLHGRWARSFLILEMTTFDSLRTRRTPLSLDAWPSDAGMPQPEADLLIAAPVDWPWVVNRAMQIAWLFKEPEDRPAYDKDLATYFKATGVDLAEHLKRYRPYLFVSNYPRPWLPVPGALSAYAPLRDAAQNEPAAREFRALMSPLIKTDQSIYGPDDVAVIHDEATDVFYLDSPLRRLFKAPAWGWGRYDGVAVLIESYSPPAVLLNRQALDPEAKPVPAAQ